MKVFKNSIKYVGIIAALFFSAHTMADDFMGADAVKALVVGSTIQAQHLKKDFEFSVHFHTDGKTATRERDGDSVDTTYKFKGDKHCIYWNGKDRCANILDNGDGTYTRVNKKGKHVVKWTKVTPG